MRRAVSILMLTLLCAAVRSAAQTTTTHTAETDNNTSACDGVGSPGGWCKGRFVGMRSQLSGTYEPVPGHVSDRPLRELLYPGSTTRIFSHLMPWFTVCHSGTTYPQGTDTSGDGYLVGNEYSKCRGHVETGYNSNDTLTVAAQMDDMLRRGFQGVVINWYGKRQGTCPGGSFCVEDITTAMVRDDLAARCSGPQSCPLLLTLDIDQGIFTQGTNACATDVNQPKCVLSRLESNLDYANASTASGGSGYFASNAYLKEGGRPVVSFFIAESSFFGQCTSSAPCNLDTGTCTGSASCWTAIWNHLRTHIQGYSNGNPYLVFRNSGGFTHAQADGAFAWQNHYHNKAGCTVDPRDANDTLGLCYLDGFYQTALAHPTLAAWGAAWRGTDGSAKLWDPNSQESPLRCGQTWLLTMAEAAYDAGSGPFYSSSRQLPYMQVGTWNDYDEGTAMEPGIDNCWAVDAAVSGSTLSWTLRVASDQPNATSWATRDTIDHFAIWDSPDGENLTLVATAPASAGSVSLSTLPIGSGARTFYVEAVGKPSILNKMSGAVAYGSGTRLVTISNPADGSLQISPVRVTASAASPDPVTLLQIYLDGAKAYEVNSDHLDQPVAVSPGTGHRLTVQAYDAAGTFKTTELIDVCALSATSPSVTICAPADASTVASPVRVLAGTTSSRPVTLIQIYLDGAKVYEENNSRLDHLQAMASGTHRLTVQAYDDLGNIFKTTVNITVP